MHRTRTLASLAATCLLVLVVACENPTRRRITRPHVPPRDLPAVLRGTIGAEASIGEHRPLLVSGFGIVVGLRGTGSSDVPIPVREQIEREAALHGFGQESAGLAGITPSRLLNDPNTAVVIVQGVIPAGAQAGYLFDLSVITLRGTSTTSLENGRLYTTQLRPGVPTAGRAQQTAIAKGGGPVFLNPFAEPGQLGEQSLGQLAGRILSGGVVTKGRPLDIILDNPSHSRARAIVDAINRRFPRPFGQIDETARGINDETIRLTIPPAWGDRPEEFIQILLHSRIDQRFPQQFAVRYADALREQPGLAGDLSWCLQAIGPHSKGAIKTLYDYPEIQPRLAALRAGARLGDPLVAPHLIELAQTGPAALRDDAIRLLAELPGPNPGVHHALHDLLNDDDVNIRIAAYETLAERADWSITRSTVGRKFHLDRVQAEKPMVYVSLQKQPRIVVFGDVQINRPLFLRTWSDRLMLSAETPQSPLRLFYRSLDGGGEPVTLDVAPELPQFIRLLAHESTIEYPAPGLELSYSETIGALYGIWKEGGLSGDFVGEQDRLTSALLAASDTYVAPARPESARVSSEDEAPEPVEMPVPPEVDEQPPTLVVPLTPEPDKDR
ncbi:MAG: flagellar basal body P-ring protein FlgI [Phycisphaerales bacterium]|nr:flagellar basal body P-ring protein FlgI [Phycisphaerales bacterium]